MNRSEDLKFIREEMGYLGIKEFPEKGVADLINTGKDKIQMDGMMQFSQYGKQHDMEYQVFLKKYDQPNLYHPYLFQATLKENPERSRAFQIRPDAFFTMADAFNLLDGRATQKLTFNARTRRMENQWFKLDFSKKDGNGNALLERFRLTRSDHNVIDALNTYPPSN